MSRAVLEAPSRLDEKQLEQILSVVRDRSADVDAGRSDPRLILGELAQAGLLDLTVDAVLAGGTPDVRATADLVSRVAGQCLSTGFVLWAHLMVLDYLARGQDTPATRDLLERARRADVVGVTAMATGMKALAGLEPLGVEGRIDGDDLVLTGRIAWASNLVPGAVIVLPVQVEDGRRVVVRIGRDDEGVALRPVTGLLALDSTASGSLALDGVRVGGQAVLSDDFASYAAAFRPGFLLVQAALAVGLARRALAESRGLVDRPANESLRDRLGEVEEQFADVEARWWSACADPAGAPVIDLLQVRLDAAVLVADATRLESTLSGGVGYLIKGSRRFREAAFFPVQSPSEGQLRWELSSRRSTA